MKDVAEPQIMAKFKVRLDFIWMIKLSTVITVNLKKIWKRYKIERNDFKKPLYFRHCT